MDFYHVNAHEFKYHTLQKYILQPFIDVGAKTDQIFHAGFGNTWYDMYAYHRAGIHADRMFIIDKQSQIYVCNASVVGGTIAAIPPTKNTTTTSDNEDDDDPDKNDTPSTKRILLDHPKQYESMKGTKFTSGYLDPNLLTYISNLP
jgi:hypothetical protein